MSSRGMPDMCYAVVPHPVGMISAEEVQVKAEEVVDEVIRLATEWRPAPADDSAAVQYYPARRFNFTGTTAELNNFFLRRNWSLGLPVVPPTVEAVSAMLAGTSRDPSEVIWVVPPRNGILTVELVAALGVMAGAKPEQMPLLLAACEAFGDPGADWGTSAVAAFPAQALLLISGPVAETLGLNAATGVAGPQNPATNALGYFLSLVGEVVGGALSPQTDLSPHGAPGDFVAAVFVEDRAANPWATSIAEDLGWSAEDSVLIAFPAGLPVGNSYPSFESGYNLLDSIAVGLAAANSGATDCLAQVGSGSTSLAMLMLSPDHAAIISMDFPDKADVAAYLVENTVLPAKGYFRCEPPAEFGSITPDTLVPRFAGSQSINLVVTGGYGMQTQIWPAFPSLQEIVSVKIEGY